MIYIFNILSADNDDFFMQIKIDSENNLYDLHNFIQNELKFDKSQMASFFLCNKTWEKQKELPLLDIETNKNIMQETKISDVIKDKNNKLLYVFDLFSDRALFISLLDIDKKNETKKIICSEKKGTIPEQIIISDNLNFDNADDFLDDEFNDDFNEDLGFENIDDYDF